MELIAWDTSLYASLPKKTKFWNHKGICNAYCQSLSLLCATYITCAALQQLKRTLEVVLSAESGQDRTYFSDEKVNELIIGSHVMSLWKVEWG